MGQPHARAAEVWGLHAQGLSVRVIAEQTGLGKSTVQRILDAGRDVLARDTQSQHQLAQQLGRVGQVQDIASWLTQRLLEEHEDSLRVAAKMEEAGNYQGLSFERRERIRGAQLLAKLHGVDPLAREKLELVRKQQQGESTLPGIIAALKLDQADLPGTMPEELARWLSPPPPLEEH